jgi:hypothetical protein
LAERTTNISSAQQQISSTMETGRPRRDRCRRRHGCLTRRSPSPQSLRGLVQHFQRSTVKHYTFCCVRAYRYICPELRSGGGPPSAASFRAQASPLTSASGADSAPSAPARKLACWRIVTVTSLATSRHTRMRPPAPGSASLGRSRPRKPATSAGSRTH